MPVEIHNKQKTQPQYVNQHKLMVPLRVVGFKANFSGGDDKIKYYENICPIGTICFSIRGDYTYRIFNTKTGDLMDSKAGDCILFVRAYEVRSIVIYNDDDPAPIL